MNFIVIISLLVLGLVFFIIHNTVLGNPDYQTNIAEMEEVLEMRQKIMDYYENACTTELLAAQDSYVNNGENVDIDIISNKYISLIDSVSRMSENEVRCKYAEINQ